MWQVMWGPAGRLGRRCGWSVAVAAGAALLVLAAGCHRPAADASAPDQPQARQTQASAAPQVGVVRPERKTVRHPIEQPGFNIAAYQETPIYPRITGYVLWKKWKIDIGDRVRKEQILAELDVPEREVAVRQKDAAIRQAKAQIKVATAAVANAKALRERFKSQYDRLASVQQGTGTLDKETVAETRLQYKASEAGLEKAAADVDAARAQLEAATADRAYAKTMLDYAQLKAPFDGVVTQRNVNDRDFVQPAGVGAKGLPLFVVSQMDPVRIFVNVPGTDAPWIKDGDAVTLQLQGAGGRVLTGRVTRNARSLDPQARTLRTEIDLPNPQGKLLPGMYVQATLVVVHRNVWTLPAGAIQTEGNQTICYRVVKGRAVYTPLQIGLSGGGLVQVHKKQVAPPSPGEEGRWEDITTDDEIAVDPAALHDGQAVRPAPAGK